MVRTFSLSYFLRLIATLVGSYVRSRREAQERGLSSGSQVLRRIYGHIVAQGLGVEKLTGPFDRQPWPRRGLPAVGQVGMASLIVLLAWAYWPGEAAAPALIAPAEERAAELLVADPPAAPSTAARPPSPTTSDASAQQIAATKERFAALNSQQPAFQADTSAASLRSGPLQFGPEVEALAAQPVAAAIEDAGANPTGDGATAQSDPGSVSLAPSRPDRLSDLFATLADAVAAPRVAVEQVVAGVGELAAGARGSRVVVEAQPTSTPLPPPPQPAPTALPAVSLAPGPAWVTFTPGPAPEVDHFWLGQAHPPGYNQFYSPNYQFGSTAGDRYRIHHGVDISNDSGTPVLAMGEGEVVHAGPDNPTLLGPYNNFYGNSVVIRLNRRLPTPEGEQDVYVLLGHLSEVYVERGQQVAQSDLVGAVGMTGIAIGPHLHVEVRVGQNSYLHSVNPALWIQNPPGAGSVAARLLTADGRSWPLARLSLLRYEGNSSRWVRTIEIYPAEENITPDPAWGENGALSNLAAGAYWIGGVVNGEKFGQNITINSGETTFVELRTQQ